MTAPDVAALAAALNDVTEGHPDAAVSPTPGTYWTDERVAIYIIAALAAQGWRIVLLTPRAQMLSRYKAIGGIREGSKP